MGDGLISTEILFSKTQECIPVGCVPSAAVAVSRGGVYLPRGCTCWGGVPGPWRGVYLLGGCTWSGGVYLPGGVPGPGGYLPGGVPGLGCTWSRGCTCPGGYLVLGGCTWSGTPPCGQTHACKNITFATSLRTVIILTGWKWEYWVKFRYVWTRLYTHKKMGFVSVAFFT